MLIQSLVCSRPSATRPCLLIGPSPSRTSTAISCHPRVPCWSSPSSSREGKGTAKGLQNTTNSHTNNFLSITCLGFSEPTVCPGLLAALTPMPSPAGQLTPFDPPLMEAVGRHSVLTARAGSGAERTTRVSSRSDTLRVPPCHTGSVRNRSGHPVPAQTADEWSCNTPTRLLKATVAAIGATGPDVVEH